jgi:hypothetical protein
MQLDVVVVLDDEEKHAGDDGFDGDEPCDSSEYAVAVVEEDE